MLSRMRGSATMSSFRMSSAKMNTKLGFFVALAHESAPRSAATRTIARISASALRVVDVRPKRAIPFLPPCV